MPLRLALGTTMALQRSVAVRASKLVARAKCTLPFLFYTSWGETTLRGGKGNLSTPRLLLPLPNDSLVALGMTTEAASINELAS